MSAYGRFTKHDSWCRNETGEEEAFGNQHRERGVARRPHPRVPEADGTFREALQWRTRRPAPESSEHSTSLGKGKTRGETSRRRQPHNLVVGETWDQSHSPPKSGGLSVTRVTVRGRTPVRRNVTTRRPDRGGHVARVPRAGFAGWNEPLSTLGSREAVRRLPGGAPRRSPRSASPRWLRSA